MPRHSLREALVEAGMKVLQVRGYHGAGVAEITAAAGAPKGSFYNHFDSKEAFAAEALADYFEGFGALFADTLGRENATGLSRVKALADGLSAALAEADYQGCLIGILALEASGDTERLMRAVNAKFATFRSALSAAILDGQTDGSVTKRLSADELASLFLSAFEGAALRAKALRDGAPLDEFTRGIEALFSA